ncbi:MAG TPA: Ldh family oxidoreductase [Thermoanaerobaculia bacterium]|nr:Ldh family oxidoreductase [Thermoanaerobaculia bacterium]
MTRWPAERLAELLIRAFAGRGLSAEHAGWVSRGLVETSLRGVDTHGVRLAPVYLAELDGGRAKARPELRWRDGGKATRVLDAGGALGHVAGTLACREAVRLALVHGVGVVAVAGSNHFGAAAVYTLEMARQGALGLAFTNSDALVAPTGGRSPLFGTNPLSLAVAAAGGEIYCLDMATSQVAYSKVASHRKLGLPLDPSWVVETADGNLGDLESPPPPFTPDLPEVAALKPLGGYKGQGLGMVVEILCALLADTPFDHELSHLYTAPWDKPRQVAHLFIALDLAAFGDPERFRTRLAQLLDVVRRSGPDPGEVVNAGDPERQIEAERRQLGIPLSEAEAELFLELERELEQEEASR